MKLCLPRPPWCTTARRAAGGCGGLSMEPHATVAQVDGDRITLWASTQDPFTLREHLYDIFRVPLNKVRIIVPWVGGGYGGKLAVKTAPLAAALSWKARRPVKLVLSVEESFKTVPRHPARSWSK